MQLAGRSPFHRAVCDTVDHQAAHPADAFPAVVIEGDRYFPALGQALVDDIEHLQE